MVSAHPSAFLSRRRAEAVAAPQDTRTAPRTDAADLGLLQADAEPLSAAHCPEERHVSRVTVLRFGTAERLLHWAIALPFLGCFVSATVLVAVYNPDPSRAYRIYFAWMHRGSAIALFVCPALVLLGSVRHWRLLFYNIRQAWGWRLDDIKWLALMGPAALSKRVVLPDQGKFNAAEKLNFMMVTTFPFLFAATGVLMWFPEVSQIGAFAPWIIHCGLAAIAIPLMLGHMFMATVNPSTRKGLMGMISGHVDAHWAAHHYAHWFREHFPHLVIHFPHLGIHFRAPHHGVMTPTPPPPLDAATASAEPANAVLEHPPGLSEPVPTADERPRVPEVQRDTRATPDAAGEVCLRDGVTARQ